MTIQEKYNHYESEYNRLSELKRKAFELHLEYCENNKDRIPRPTWRHFVNEYEFGINSNLHKMNALKEFL